MHERVLALAAAVMLVVGCSPPDDLGSSSTTPSTRPADKATCNEVTLVSEYPPLDRRLVPYSSTLLGVETEWGHQSKHVLVVSGGYLDDVFEPYDDLDLYSTAEVGGYDADLLSTVLLNRTVFAAVWRTAEISPCDAKAIIATGLDQAEFESLLGDLVQP